MKGVATEEAAGDQSEQGAALTRLGLERDTSEEEIKQEGVEIVNDEVEDFVMLGRAGLNLVLYPESECCGRPVGLENIF